MNIGNKGLDLIKSFEGCRLSAYTCPAGVWTIGYGHTQGVYPGMTISQAQADKFLFEDVKYYADAVDRYNSRFNFTQEEFDALTSFTYNCGVGSLNAVMSCCNSKKEIAEECKLYNKGGGVVLAGLVRRREEEYNLFMSGSSNSTSTASGTSYPEKGEYFFNTRVKIRTAPNLDNSSFTGICYEAGESVEYHTVHRNKCGYNWIQYNRGNGTQGYCAITNVSTGEKFGYAQ